MSVEDFQTCIAVNAEKSRQIAELRLELSQKNILVEHLRGLNRSLAMRLAEAQETQPHVR